MASFSINMQECTLTRVETRDCNGVTRWEDYQHTRAYLGERSLIIVCMATGAFVASTPRSRVVSFMRCPDPSQTKGCPHAFCKLDSRLTVMPPARLTTVCAGRGQNAGTVTPREARKPLTERGWAGKIGDRIRGLIGAGSGKARKVLGSAITIIIIAIRHRHPKSGRI